MEPSLTEIAVEMAQRMAQQQGGELESFSLDGVESHPDADGEVVTIQMSARIAPARGLASRSSSRATASS
jgi:hypothetical protein